MAELEFTKILDNGVFRVLQFRGTPNDHIDYPYRTSFTPADQVTEIGIIMSGSWMIGPYPDRPPIIEPAGHSDHLDMAVYNPPGKPPGPRSRRCLETGAYVCCTTKTGAPFNSRRLELQTGNTIVTNPNDLIVMPIGSFTIDGTTYSAPTIMTISASKNIIITSNSIVIEFWLK